MALNIIKKTSTVNTTQSIGRKIEYIAVHYTAGTNSKQGAAKNTASWFANKAAKASADFIVDDTDIVQFNPDPKDRYCWAVGGKKYSNKGGSLYGIAKNANTISVEICSTNKTGKVPNANDSTWSFTDSALDRAVELIKFLMKEYKISASHVIRHYDVNGKPCPGIIGWNADSGDESEWAKFHARLSGSVGLQSKELKGLSEADVIAKVGPMFTADQKNSGVLASVSLAQFVLESGYGKTDLAQEANNCFGMKCTLSQNRWKGSSWDGKSKYTKKTQEQKTDGTAYYVTADFRKYKCIEDSIADHSAYLAGAMNGNKLRYDGLKGCKDYKKAVQIIKNGGYATDVSYVSKICNIIEKWGLTKYEAQNAGDILPEAEKPWYRVRKSWGEASTQIGAYHDLNLAKKCAKDNPGYSVFDENGKYIGADGAPQKIVTPPYEAGKTYTTQVELKVRTGAGTSYPAKKYSQLTANAKKNDSDKDGAIDKGTRVTCQEVKQTGDDVWIRIPSGWIAAYYQGKTYVK